jgi:hypothetical protein
MPSEMTLWESLMLRRWGRTAFCQVLLPRARRAMTALRVEVYHAAYW